MAGILSFNQPDKISRKRVIFLVAILGMLAFSGHGRGQTRELSPLDYPPSLESLMERFKGQVVYIDVMASWCKACLQELGSYAETDDFFQENGIVKLFISIDGTPEEIERCAELIQNRNIDGYFIPFTQPKDRNMDSTFPQDVEPFFITRDKEGNIQELAIPQYLIVDKNGRVVEYKAKRPSDPKGLKEQLSRYF